MTQPVPRTLYAHNLNGPQHWLICLQSGLCWYLDPSERLPLDMKGWEWTASWAQSRYEVVASDLTDGEIASLDDPAVRPAAVDTIIAARQITFDVTHPQIRVLSRAVKVDWIQPEGYKIRKESIETGDPETGEPWGSETSWVWSGGGETGDEDTCHGAVRAAWQHWAESRSPEAVCAREQDAEIERWRKAALAAEEDREHWRDSALSFERDVARAERERDQWRKAALDSTQALERLESARLAEAEAEADTARREVTRLERLVIALAARLVG